MGRNKKRKDKLRCPDNGLDMHLTLNEGIRLHQQGDLEGARRIYSNILSSHPDQGDALYLSGVAFLQGGLEEQAISFLEKALHIDPHNQEYAGALLRALNNHGLTKQERGDYEKALLYYDRALELDPDFLMALNNKGMVSSALNHVSQAVDCYLKALSIDPSFYEAWVNLGNVYKDRGDYDQALECYQKALELKPSSWQVFNNIGSVLNEKKDYETAKQYLLKAIELNPQYDEAYYNLGCVCFELDQTDDAVRSYLKCLEINPGYAKAYSNAGNVFFKLKHYDDAEACYLKACELQPGLAEAYNNAGNLYQSRNDLEKAVFYLEKASDLSPDVPEFKNNLGLVYKKCGNNARAEDCFKKAIDQAPNFADPHFYLGEIYKETLRFGHAVTCYEKTLELQPDFPLAPDQLCATYQRLCDWDKAQPLIERMQHELETGDTVTELPHNSLSRYEDAKLCYTLAKLWSDNVSEAKKGENLSFTFGQHRKHGSKIRVGYFSNTFNNHPGGHLIAGLFGCHNRKDFEIYLYSFGPDDGSYYRKKAESECDKFIDIRLLDDREAAKRIYGDKIDILVDLRGYTQNNRVEVCALHPAPVQVVYLGFAGTSGSTFYDYIIADKTIVPEEHRPYFSEHIVYMPDCYQVTNHEQAISGETFTRKDQGLPEDGVVFCSFNASYKFEPVMYGCWMDIMKAVPGSVLWLLDDSEAIIRNLVNEAEARGVGRDRLVFAKRMPKKRHLKRSRLADISLDTRIYTGHTTTSDSLWAGVPVISMLGNHFASRVSASIIRAAGLPELVVSDLKAYKALAVDLALNPDKLRLFKQRVWDNRTTHPLFNTPLFARNLEKAYTIMWDSYVTGKAPDTIAI